MGKAPVVWEQKMVRVFEYAQRMEGDRYFTGLVTCNIKYPFRTKYGFLATFGDLAWGQAEGRRQKAEERKE